jgi:hypothetical protein
MASYDDSRIICLTLHHGYVFAEMAVHQTREFMHKKYGGLARNCPTVFSNSAYPRFLNYLLPACCLSIFSRALSLHPPHTSLGLAEIAQHI